MVLGENVVTCLRGSCHITLLKCLRHEMLGVTKPSSVPQRTSWSWKHVKFPIYFFYAAVLEVKSSTLMKPVSRWSKLISLPRLHPRGLAGQLPSPRTCPFYSGLSLDSQIFPFPHPMFSGVAHYHTIIMESNKISTQKLNNLKYLNFRSRSQQYLNQTFDLRYRWTTKSLHIITSPFPFHSLWRDSNIFWNCLEAM